MRTEDRGDVTRYTYFIITRIYLHVTTPWVKKGAVSAAGASEHRAAAVLSKLAALGRG